MNRHEQLHTSVGNRHEQSYMSAGNFILYQLKHGISCNVRAGGIKSVIP